MGVLGLWQLLQPSSRPLKMQGLEGKKIAIDISIWLYQATKGTRNSRNGHIAVLYSRICKLLYFKIKPIFVFDGPNVPKLKERVLKKRQQRRNEAADKAKEIDDKIQKNLLESHALKHVLGLTNSEDLIEGVEPSTSTSGHQKTNNKSTSGRFGLPDDDLFKLPETCSLDKEQDSDDEVIQIDKNDLKHSYMGLNEIDKDVFENLPSEIQFEILANYKETLKSKKSLSFDEFPERSEDFSQYQMRLLLHKNEVSSQINNLKASMKITNSIDTNFDKIYHQKVASEDNDEVILLTKKNTASKLLSQKSSTECIKIDEEKEDYLNFEDSNKSPEFRIEFTQSNKIELVPKLSKTLSNHMIHKPTEILQNEIINEPFLQDKDFEILEPVKQGLSKSSVYQREEPIKFIAETKTNSKEPFLLDKEFEIIELRKEQLNKPNIYKRGESVQFLPQNNDIIFLNEKNNVINDIPEIIQIEEEATNEPEESESDDDDGDDFIEVASELKSTNEEILIDSNAIQPTTSSRLKEIINLEATEEYSTHLLNERNNFIREKQNNEILSHSIESYVIEDAKNLLQLFGLPFITAPGEAEAQCAYLDFTNITEGSITEDSDVWLFGARRVYKNFFSTDQFIDSYSHQVIKSQLGLDRESLIEIAMLVGSDYTEGIENVGIVKAVEILQEFEGEGIEKLKNFKKWQVESQQKSNSRNENKLRLLLKKLKLPENFPSELVYDAYMKPDVDKSSEEFSWSLPNLDLLRKFLVAKMQWTIKKIDDDVLPVIKRINETNVQKTLDSFFSYETTSSFSKQSKRMKNAIKSFKTKKDKLSNNNNNNNNDDDEDLNLSDDEIYINNTDSLQQQQLQNKQKLVSSITITRLNKTRSNQPDTTLTHNNIERLTNSNEPIINESSSSLSTNKKRKSTESTSINNKIKKK